MPFVTFANTALLEMVYQWNGIICENTLYFRSDTTFTSGMLDDVTNDLFSWWSSNIKPLQSDQLALIKIIGRDMSTQFGAYYEYAPLTGNVGTNTSPSMPNNVAVAVKFTTGLVGRRNRGRNFFCGLTEGQITGNGLDSTFTGLLTDAYNDLNAEVGLTTNSVHVIASRALAVAPSYTGVTIPVTGCTTDLTVDTMRRRLS